jgi:hypothetical protein
MLDLSVSCCRLRLWRNVMGVLSAFARPPLSLLRSTNLGPSPQKMYKDSFLLEKEVFPPGHRLTRPTMARVLWKLVGELQPPVRLHRPYIHRTRRDG